MLEKKVVLVTGASRGIGHAILSKFANDNFVVVGTATSAKGLAEIDRVLEGTNTDGMSVQLDLSSVESINGLAETLKSSKLGVDILINNAGITGPTAELWNYNIKDWNSVVDINLHGTFYCCKSIVPHMIKNNYGRIVNIASVAGKDGNANASAYSSAKAGILGLTKSLGKELAKYNIAVNAITPAGAKTRILDQMSKEHVQWMLSKVPRGRFLELNELSSMVCWLSSEENSFSTAAVFDISGGRSTY